MAGTTDSLIERLERQFNVDDLDSGFIFGYLTEGKIGSHQIKYGFDKQGNQKFSDSSGISGGGLSNIQRLANDLGRSTELKNKATTAKDFRELERLKDETSSLKIHRNEVSKFIESKLQTVRQEELKEKGKSTTLFRDELRRASSISDIDNILSKAKTELGEGKNYDSLVEGADSLRGRFS